MGARDYSAGNLLVAVVLASILPFLVVGSVLLIAYVNIERDQALSRVPALSDSLSDAIDRKLAGYISNLRALASAVQMEDVTTPRISALARSGAEALGGSIVLLDTSGRQIVNTASAADDPLPMTADPEAAHRLFSAGKPDVSDLVQGNVHNRQIFAVRVPIKSDDEFRYSLGYVPPANEVESIVRELRLPKGWFAAVIDRKGVIVARSYRHEDFYGKPASPHFLMRLTGQSGVLDSVDLEHRQTVTAYRASDLSGWRSLVWVSKDVLEAKANTAFWVLVSLAAVTLFVSLLVGYLVAHYIRAPTRQLVAAAHALAAGGKVEFDRSLMREANVVGSALIDAANDVRVFMLEISHRSKNLLAVIQALARQTQRSASSLDDFGVRFSNRLQSLAHSHDLLVDRNWEGIEVADLVRAQLKAFTDQTDSRVQATGEVVLLSPAMAQHIGLALHELATNATKYGALSIPSGRVLVTWHTTRSNDGANIFDLSWVERGGPPLTRPTRAGFGTAVLEQLAARGVGGKTDVRWNEEGMEWRLTAPLARAATFNFVGEGGS